MSRVFKKKKINKVKKLFNQFKRKGLLEDRSEYDVGDLKSAYSELTTKQAKKLYKRLQTWRRR